MMAYVYRDIAYEAHMKRFVPMKGSFWAKSIKKRWQALDDQAKIIAEKYINKMVFCECGHLEENHKMPGGVYGFGCNVKDCSCKKFVDDRKPIMNGNKLVKQYAYPPGKIYDPVTDSFVLDPYEE